MWRLPYRKAKIGWGFREGGGKGKGTNGIGSGINGGEILG
jgi:hypothetical protein